MATTPDPTGAGDRGNAQPALQPPGTKQTFRDLGRTIVELWWRFFDWLAIVSWTTLLIVFVLGLIAAGILHYPKTFLFFVLFSVIVKVIAGGKRRADMIAEQATQRAQTEQLERTVLEARMEALQAQIEPHFLFNTLASIDQLIRTDPPRASQMQQSLIRYLRSAMPQLRDGSRPTLGQQVDLSKAYLDIMAVRMEERLTTVINVPDVLRSAVFPAMMLQTLVENAIKHGLEPKGAGGRLEISAEVESGRLAVHIVDDGIGFAPRSDDGVGLANIRERLRALYNGRAELIIGIPSTGGTSATIKVPYESVAATT